jgi:DNA-binding response OmpR family regulator
MLETAEMTFSFGDFELDGAKRRLVKKRRSIPLNSKTLDLPHVLAKNRGRVLSKDELPKTKSEWTKKATF